MLSTDDLRFIDQLAKSGTLAAAARELNVTPPALSMRLKKLEATLGASLVIRDSRRLALTPEGARLLALAREALERIRAIPEAVRVTSQTLVGPLRVAAPFGFGRAYVGPMLARFHAEHPAVQSTLVLTETPLAQMDAADVVVHIGHVRDSSWVAYPLARNDRWLVASPKYLARRDAPQRPDDVSRFACLCLRENEEDVTLWHFQRGDATRAVRVTPALISNDGEVVRNWALAGLGLAIRSEWDVAPLVRAGKLVRVLPGYSCGNADVVALVPTRTGRSNRVSTFVRFMRQQFQPKAAWRES